MNYNFLSDKKEGQEGDVRPAWMKSLATSVKNWLSILPEVRVSHLSSIALAF